MTDARQRDYLSAQEVAGYTRLSVQTIHRMARAGKLPSYRAASGQYRFRLADIAAFRAAGAPAAVAGNGKSAPVAGFAVHCGDARNMKETPSGAAHLAITSPPYFNAKMYAHNLKGDLGDIHDLSEWLEEMRLVWGEVFRVLAPGRKFFLNIMNLPAREKGGGFRCINLVGRAVDLCESVGFVFKRDIVWQKTNGVRAHFGTYPYPGGILINNMHEFILEFQKPEGKGGKYAHVSAAQKEASKLDREFWLSLKNSDVWLMKPEASGAKRQHAAPFPLELPARLVRAFSYAGETVLDPFLGSGTTLVAAAQLGRRGIGYDINPEFCRLATRRIKATTPSLFGGKMEK